MQSIQVDQILHNQQDKDTRGHHGLTMVGAAVRGGPHYQPMPFSPSWLYFFVVVRFPCVFYVSSLDFHHKPYFAAFFHPPISILLSRKVLGFIFRVTEIKSKRKNGKEAGSGLQSTGSGTLVAEQILLVSLRFIIL